MAERHISIPKSFASGDALEWFQRFEICSRANGWDAATMTVKLPTLLEGEALATWLDLSEVERGNFETAKKTITGKLMPAPFVTLDEFHRRKLLLGEALSVFVHDLKKLLGQAMSNLDAEARDQLLLHQFLAGIPPVIGRQLRATGEAKTLEAAVERARLLMTLDDQAHAAVVREGAGDVEQLKEQIGKLTEQVAALTTASLRTTNREQRRCFACNRMGHMQRDCPFRHQGSEGRRCFTCGRQGHLARECRQGNDQGASVKGNRRPQPPQ